MIYEILYHEDLAKRIGFKKIFMDTVLGGVGGQYKDAVEVYEEELHELDRFGFYENMKALGSALTSIGWCITRNPYSDLTSAVYAKLKGMKLDAEKQLVAESRATLTGYDDFMFGLRSNQSLYQEQVRAYRNKVATLQEKYNAAKKMLLCMAQEQGVVLRLPDSPLHLAAPESE